MIYGEDDAADTCGGDFVGVELSESEELAHVHARGFDVSDCASRRKQ